MTPVKWAAIKIFVGKSVTLIDEEGFVASRRTETEKKRGISERYGGTAEHGVGR